MPHRLMGGRALYPASAYGLPQPGCSIHLDALHQPWGRGHMFLCQRLLPTLSCRPGGGSRGCCNSVLHGSSGRGGIRKRFATSLSLPPLCTPLEYCSFSQNCFKETPGREGRESALGECRWKRIRVVLLQPTSAYLLCCLVLLQNRLSVEDHGSGILPARSVLKKCWAAKEAVVTVMVKAGYAHALYSSFASATQRRWNF